MDSTAYRLPPRHPLRLLSRGLARGGATVAWALVCGLCVTPSLAEPVVLAPQYGPSTAAGGGADASFVQIDPHWHGSTVLWNEALQQYGNGSPGNGWERIGAYSWGSGLWGRADFDAVIEGLVPAAHRWEGSSGAINFGNDCYNLSHSNSWGLAKPLPAPLSDSGACRSGDDADHGNWVAQFEGFIRITDAGRYNFSVLYDDGFFLRLVGEGGSSVEIGRDFLNARDRLGFDQDLALLPGLYGFELGVWNRLQAGVVDLRVSRDGGRQWDLVDPLNLLPTSAVPLSPTWMLVLMGILPALARRRRRPSGAG